MVLIRAQVLDNTKAWVQDLLPASISQLQVVNVIWIWLKWHTHEHFHNIIMLCIASRIRWRKTFSDVQRQLMNMFNRYKFLTN